MLILELVANSNTYRKEPSKIPSVEYVTSEKDNTNAKDWQESDEGGKITSEKGDAKWQEKYKRAIQNLFDGLQPKHTYYVEINIGDSGLVDKIIIYYDKDEE